MLRALLPLLCIARGSSSGVVNLDVHNFSTVHGDNGAGWLVSFFSATCSHCQLFAPELLSLPAKLQARGITGVSIGAVDLNEKDNEPLGVAFGVESLPSLRFIKQQGSDGSGERVNDVISHSFPRGGARDTLVEFIEGGYRGDEVERQSVRALGAGVVPLDRSNFSVAVASTGTGWLLSLTAASCPACGALSLEMSKLATGAALRSKLRLAEV